MYKMKQSVWPLRCGWALLWAMLPVAAAMKLTQESNFSTDLESALIARSSQTSNREHANTSEKSLDTVTSGKNGFITDLGGTFGRMATALANAGQELGKAAGNAFVVVGKRAIKAPTMRFDDLDQEFKDAANQIGNQVEELGGIAIKVGQASIQASFELAGHLKTAAESAYQGAKYVANQVKNAIEDLVNCFVDSLTNDEKKCESLMGEHCDCSQGKSYMSVNIGGPSLSLKCAPKTSSKLTGKRFRLKATANSNGDAGVLPGSDEEVDNLVLAVHEKLREATPAPTRQEMIDTLTPQSGGECQGSLEVAVDAVVQFNPTVEVQSKVVGAFVETVIKISGWVRASVDTLVKGEGSCMYTAQRGFPKKPKTKTVCAKGVCILFAMQMLATLELKGTLTGTIETAHDVDFWVEGNARIFSDPSKQTEVDVEVGQVRYEDAIEMSASATASLRTSVGPRFVVWPTPGLPVTFHPQVHAEAAAIATMKQNSDGNKVLGLADPPSDSRTGAMDMCGAAVLTIYSDMGITGFALPPPLDQDLTDELLKTMIKEGIREGVNKAFPPGSSQAQQCAPPGVNQLADRIADEAASMLAAVAGGFGLPLQLDMVELLSSDKLFCEEVWRSPGFSEAPCAEDLGCKNAGKGRLPEPNLLILPPQELPTQTTITTTHAKVPCINIPMGDRFIQIGEFRIADIDGNFLSISHQDGSVLMLFEKGKGPSRSNPSNTRFKTEAWNRPIETAAKGVKMGFQFIQIGNFRLGSDDWALTMSHVDKEEYICEWVYNGHIFNTGPRHTLDRPEGPPAGITAGYRIGTGDSKHWFIQIGKFRIGANLHPSDAKPNSYLSFVHMPNEKLIETLRSDGSRTTNNDRLAETRLTWPSPWFCPSVAELAYGRCDAKFGGWGDRFIQLGLWRIAAVDGGHFSISHANGKTAQIFRFDGHVFNGPRNDWGSRDRPLGRPDGIAFGKDFVQIGSFRLTALDANHLSLSHQNGFTQQIWRNDNTRHPGPHWHHFNGWLNDKIWNLDEHLLAGPSNVGFGDRFLQIGNFRIGAADDAHLVVTHTAPSGVHTPVQVWDFHGVVHGGIPGWEQPVAGRPSQAHCGSIQAVFKTCPGIVAGDRFLQLGDWRLAAAYDHVHFSISHRRGQTAELYNHAGAVAPGPHGLSFTSWDREASACPAGYCWQKLKYGDRFIEIGGYRIGHKTEESLTISNRHFHGGEHAIVEFCANGDVKYHSHTPQGYNMFSRPYAKPHEPPKGISFGDRFVQIGQFRLGDVDGEHFSIAFVGEGNKPDRTIAYYKMSGERVLNPSNDREHTTVGRPMADCQVLPDP